MRLTIIKNDNFVYVDGLACRVDCSDLPADFHALQWYDTAGEIEITNERGHHVENRAIVDVTPYQKYVDAWNAAKSASDAAAAAALAAEVAMAKPPAGAVNVLVR